MTNSMSRGSEYTYIIDWNTVNAVANRVRLIFPVAILCGTPAISFVAGHEAESTSRFEMRYKQIWADVYIKTVLLHQDCVRPCRGDEGDFHDRS